MLHSKFDLPREVFLQALNSLIKMGQLDYDAQCLSVATSELRKAYNTLMKYGDGSATQLMTVFCDLQISSSLKKKWILHQEDPPMDSFLDFTDKRLTLLTATKSTIKCPTKPPPSSPPRRSSWGAVMHLQPTALLVSKGIESTNVRLDTRQKERPGKRVRLCFNFLSTGHQSVTCPRHRGCRVCSEKHHSLLHNASATPTISIPSTSVSISTTISTSGSGSASAPSQPTVLRVGDDTSTALMVLVSSGSRSTLVRALLDSGASVTLVSSRLANSARAKRLLNPVQLAGMYSSGSSKHTTSLTFSSVNNPEEKREGMVCPHNLMDLMMWQPLTSRLCSRCLSCRADRWQIGAASIKPLISS